MPYEGESLVSAAAVPASAAAPPSTISPWGRAGHTPKAAYEGALFPLSSQETLFCPLQPAAFSASLAALP